MCNDKKRKNTSCASNSLHGNENSYFSGRNQLTKCHHKQEQETHHHHKAQPTQVVLKKKRVNDKMKICIK